MDDVVFEAKPKLDKSRASSCSTYSSALREANRKSRRKPIKLHILPGFPCCCRSGGITHSRPSHTASLLAHLRKTLASRGGTPHLCSPPAMFSQSLHESSPSAMKSPSFSTMSRRHVGTSSCGPAILNVRICAASNYFSGDFVCFGPSVCP